jgi:hypothetical protein
MRKDRILAALALVLFWRVVGEAQIIILKKVGDREVACRHSGLTSSFKDCGVRDNWYAYVFVGQISAVTPVENYEKEIQVVPEDIFLGEPATPLKVKTSQADCMPEFKVGDRWLFYLREQKGQPIVLDYYANDSLPLSDAQERVETLRRLKEIGDFALLRGKVVRGPDVEFNPEVIPDAQVTASGRFSHDQFVCRTGKDGRYAFPPLPPGYYAITVQPIGSYQPDDSRIVLRSGTCRDLTLGRSPHGQIGGRVSHFDGTPVRNVDVVLMTADNSSFQTTQTDENGRYTFYSETAGEYVIGLNFPPSPDWINGGGAGPGVKIAPASLFYPGVSNRSSARVIRLATDEKRDDLDFVVPKQ